MRCDINDEIPCDIVLLSSSDIRGECYITTANLDGETNLKVIFMLTLPRILVHFYCPYPKDGGRYCFHRCVPVNREVPHGILVPGPFPGLWSYVPSGRRVPQSCPRSFPVGVPQSCHWYCPGGGYLSAVTDPARGGGLFQTVTGGTP